MLPEFTVTPISGKTTKDYIRKNHYSKSCHNGPIGYGLYNAGGLLGAIAFACPCSENVRRSIFGEDYAFSVIELHRLFVEDGTPKNTESWFISRALSLLRKQHPKYTAVLSFADTTEGHVGYVYQACNFLYCGLTTSNTRFWRDQNGSLRHPRQCGMNITTKEAEARGWTPEKRGAKHRYLYLLSRNKVHRKELLSNLRLSILPYPKK